MEPQIRNRWEQNISRSERKIYQIQDELSNLCNLVTRLRHVSTDTGVEDDSRDGKEEQHLSNTRENNKTQTGGSADPQKTGLNVMQNCQEPKRTLKLDKAAAKRMILRYLNLKY